MNRYIEVLNQTAEEMQSLAKRLDSSKARPLNKEEKELIRLAAIPWVRGMLNDVLITFIGGEPIAKHPAFDQLHKIAEDLNTQ